LISSKDIEQYEDADRIPRCPKDNKPLKPNVVLFEEMLPKAFEKAETIVFSTDLLIVVGSSLAVYPVANMPHLVTRMGGKVVIINQGETEYDNQADLKIDGRAGDVLPQIYELVAQM
jgi:NAD-dependent deacetylase